ETYSSWFVPHLTEYDANAALLFPLMREAGIHTQIGYPCIVTTAHTEADLQRVVDVFLAAVDTLQGVGILQPQDGATAAATAPATPAPATGA
ncbi:MAG: hypothetical protein KDK53_19470, partial [Maritimibacter sp.]|nr:hypothetical protein [Maritimibacter sp.]